MSLIEINIRRPAEPRFICVFEHPVILRYEHSVEMARAVGCDAPDPQGLMVIKEHRINWDRPVFARDDLDDSDRKLIPFIVSLDVMPVERRYIQAELATIGRRREKLFGVHIGGATLGYYAGIATSIEQAVRWVETGEGLPAITWQGA